MGITWERTTKTTCKGVCCKRVLDESINYLLQDKGSCDKRDLPWLLATYVGEGGKKEHRGERQKEGMSKCPCVNGSVEVKVKARRRKTTPCCIYTE